MKKSYLFKMAAVFFAAAMLCSCGAQRGSDGDALGEITTSDTYPQAPSDVTLRYWVQLHTNVAATTNSMNDLPYHEFIEEATGIKVSYEHPALGSEAESFNMMIMSDDMPDLIEAAALSNYPGGIQQAIDDGIIADLNPYIEKVAPNLKKLLQENPEWTKDISTENGSIYAFPMLLPDETNQTYVSWFVRKDLLDKAGLDLPVTYDDWEKMLYAFKDLGVEIPITINLSNQGQANTSSFTSKFNTVGTWYQRDGKVVFGPAEKEYGEYIKLLKKWYDEGILDKNFADTSAKRLTADAANGKIGAIQTSVGGTFGNILSAIPKGSEIEFVPVTIPVNNEGETPMWNQRNFPVSANGFVAVSAKSKNKELAVRFLDFGYSEEGYLLNNFGKEGVSYTMEPNEDGELIPTYTDLVTDYEKNGGLTLGPSIARYARASWFGPFAQSPYYIHQYYKTDVQKTAISKWGSDTLNYKLPTLTYSAEKRTRYSDLLTPINTYREETVAKIVSGKLDISYLDEYFSEMERLGIDELTDIVQEAYNDYLKKPSVMFD